MTAADTYKCFFFFCSTRLSRLVLSLVMRPIYDLRIRWIYWAYFTWAVL